MTVDEVAGRRAASFGYRQIHRDDVGDLARVGHRPEVIEVVALQVTTVRQSVGHSLGDHRRLHRLHRSCDHQHLGTDVGELIPRVVRPAGGERAGLGVGAALQVHAAVGGLREAVAHVGLQCGRRERAERRLGGVVGDGRLVRRERWSPPASAGHHRVVRIVGGRRPDALGREHDRLEGDDAPEQRRFAMCRHQQAGAAHRVAERADRAAGALHQPVRHRGRVVAVAVPFDRSRRPRGVAVAAVVERDGVAGAGECVGERDVATAVKAGGVGDEQCRAGAAEVVHCNPDTVG